MDLGKHAVRRNFYLVFFICVAMLVGTAPAQAAHPSNFVSFNMPIGVAATRDAMLIMGYYAPYSGAQTVYSADSAGALRPFAPTFPSASGYNERYLDISPGKGGFKKDYAYMIQSNQIFEVSPDGGSVRLFATLPVYVFDHNGVTFDRVGTFGYKLIATLSNGMIFTVDSSGAAVLLANIGTQHENPEVVPAGFGPYGGYVWTASETTNRVYAFSPSGQVYIVSSGIPTAESVHVIPEKVCEFGSSGGAFFISDYPNRIVKYPASDFAGLGGNVLVTSEAGYIYMISKNAAGTGYTTSVFDPTYRQHEGGTFARCPLNEAPVANAGPDRTVECTGLSCTGVTLNGSDSSDPDGDPLTYTWTWNGGTASGENATVSLPLGITEVTLTVDDGKEGTAADTVLITVSDTTPPSTTAMVSGTLGQNGWYVSNVTVNLDATDACTGVKEVHYTINGVETVVSGSTAQFALSSDGSYRITYWSVDNNGTAGVPDYTSLNREAAPPVTTPIVPAPPDDGSGYYRSCVPVTLSTTSGAVGNCADPVQPGRRCNLAPLHGEFTVCGSQTVNYKAVSNAGNAEQPKVLVINIDQTPPTIAGTVSPAPNAFGWNSTDVAIIWTCNDSGSGIASCQAPATVQAEGAGQVITGEAVDRAGNRATGSVSVNIDKTLPVITAVVAPASNAYGWQNMPVTVTFACSDTGSGIAACTAPVVVATEGERQVVTGTATDRAGNTATIEVLLNIDRTAPEIAITGCSGRCNLPGLFRTDAPVHGNRSAFRHSLAKRAVVRRQCQRCERLYLYGDCFRPRRQQCNQHGDVSGYLRVRRISAAGNARQAFQERQRHTSQVHTDERLRQQRNLSGRVLSLQFVSGELPIQEPIDATSNVPDSRQPVPLFRQRRDLYYNLATDSLASGRYLATVTTDDGATQSVIIQIKP